MSSRDGERAPAETSPGPSADNKPSV
jgi:hypothetical protein